MKKVVNYLIIFLSILIIPFTTSIVNGYCLDSTLLESFNTNYVEYSNDCYNAEISETNVDDYINKSITILTLGEQVKESMTEEEYLYSEFRGKYFDVLSYYGKFCIKKIGYNFNPENYANTNGGSIKLENAKIDAENKIKKAQSMAEVLEAYNGYFEVLNGELAVKVSSLNTKEESLISSSIATSDNSNVFASDDVYSVVKFNSKIYTKNLNNALLNNEECTVENGGVAYYFDVKLKRNGVIVEQEYENSLTVKISLENLNLKNANDGDNVQIAVYDKGNISFIDAAIVDGNVVFEINKFGKYALILKDYKTKSTSVVLDFFNDYGIYVYIGLGVLFILFIFIKIKKHKKKKKLKKQMKEFKKFQQENNKKDK